MKEGFVTRWGIHMFILLIFLTIEAESEECFLKTKLGRCCVYNKAKQASCTKETNKRPMCESTDKKMEACDILGFDNGICNISNSMLCGWDSRTKGSCNWEIDLNAQNRLTFATGDIGHTKFTKSFKRSYNEPYLCVRFNNSRNSNKFSIKVNGEEMIRVLEGDVEIWCFQYKDVEVNYEITLSAYCNVAVGSAIEDLVVVERSDIPVTPTQGSFSTSDVNPTESGDIQYVGVVVGAICIALFTLFSCLTIISARRSNQRDSRRHELHSGACPEEDDRPDVVADNAPPSYDAVMACPNMYPPTPQGTPPGTPDSTPYLSLHRRTLLSQLATAAHDSPQSQRQSMTLSLGSQLEDESDEPPPPYPGNVENRKSEQNTRDANIDNAGTGESTSEEVNSALSTSQEIPRTGSDLSPIGLSRDERREDNNPWILNVADDHSMETNPRRNNTWPRNPRENDESAGDLALRVRTSGDVDGGDVNERTESTSLATDTHLGRQDLTEVAVINDIQYPDLNSANCVGKSSKNNRSSTISNLAMV